jgi:WXXGXW repeat (2 copies)
MRNEGQKEAQMRNAAAIRGLLCSFALLVFSHVCFGQIGISVSFGPPALPVYEQPICPEEGYIWTPGFWDYTDDDGYYWVPGTWVEAPQPGYLWTPGYWGWGDEGAFIFHEGYWGEHVGFYGGVNYGFGYGGRGYEGGRWDNGHFFYNTSVNRVNVTVIHNTYNTRVVENNTTRVSYNGGAGGVEARATAQEETYSKEQHVGRVAAQTEHIQQARSNPELRASNNQGKPPIAATAKPGDFKTAVVPAKEAGGAYKAPPANAAHAGNKAPAGNEGRPAAEAHPATQSADQPPTAAAKTPANGHAAELQPHTSTPPNTGNAATDKRYQQQQAQLTAKQNQEHQKVQQQQEKEHQQAAKKNTSDAQKEQMEQRHTQQTQQLEQKHTAQQQQLQQRQQPAAKPAEKQKP